MSKKAEIVPDDWGIEKDEEGNITSITIDIVDVKEFEIPEVMPLPRNACYVPLPK